jgi:outer membrane protein OmpA-like peptidoglycan-associated protein
MVMNNLRIFTIAVLIFASISLSAQRDGDTTHFESPVDRGNMLENGDLENYTGKLNKNGRFYLVDSWDVLSTTRADYFEEDNELAMIGIPDNVYGSQKAFNGEHYAGINAFSFDPKNNRSYIYTALKSPLQKGQLYCVKYYVNLADRSRFAIANLGAYFSDSKFKDDEDGNVFFEAQIMNDNQKILKNIHQWEVVCNVLTATGKEEYFVIGNFDTDQNTVKEEVIAPIDMEGTQVQMAYYYIDYISVSPVARFSDCNCSARKERGPDIVYSKAETVDETAADEEIIKGSTIYFGFLKKDMNSSAKSDLDRLVSIMEDNENYRVKITGHVDSEEAADLGDDEAAKDFSRDRAYAALDYISDNGINKSRFDVYGYGKTYPANSGSTPLSKAKNRRVEFELITD